MKQISYDQANESQANGRSKWTDVQSQNLWSGRERIEMRKYPYDWKDTIRNMDRYGIKEALKHDWSRTKESVGDRIWGVVEDTFLLGFATVAVPTIIALTGYSLWEEHRSKRIK